METFNQFATLDTPLKNIKGSNGSVMLALRACQKCHSKHTECLAAECMAAECMQEKVNCASLLVE